MLETVHRNISSGIGVILLAVVIGLPSPAAAETVSGTEYKVKLGFIYHFIAGKPH